MSITALLEKSKSLREKATLGPWYIEDSEIRASLHNDSDCGEDIDCTVQICDVSRISEKLDHRKPNREFILHLGNTSEAKDRIIEVLRDGLIACQGVMFASDISKEYLTKANAIAEQSLKY